jgi:hypothetical protein
MLFYKVNAEKRKVETQRNAKKRKELNHRLLSLCHSAPSLRHSAVKGS